MPEDNESQRNNDFVKENFATVAPAEQVYLMREDGSDVLTPQAFDKLLSIHNEVIALQWKNTKDEGNPSAPKLVSYLPDTQALADLCLNTQDEEGAEGGDVLDCTMTIPLEPFGCTPLSRRDACVAYACRDNVLQKTSLLLRTLVNF